MIVVIQCAASKRAGAGTFLSGERPVSFVAQPHMAPVNSTSIYARPDDLAQDGVSWRSKLAAYNQVSNSNPLRLLRAFELYENAAYGKLVRRYGLDKVFILSAGWGLVSADFLLPSYDITFSASADAYKTRSIRDTYADFRMIPNEVSEEIVFVGGKDYVPLFATLTANVKAKRTIYYNSSTPPVANGCNLERFVTTTRTNWHYECANWLLK